MSHVDLVADLLANLINAPTVSERERLGREVLDLVKDEWEANDAAWAQILAIDTDQVDTPAFRCRVTGADEVPV